MYVPAYVIFVPAFQPRLTGTSSTSDCCTLLQAAASHTCRVTYTSQSGVPYTHPDSVMQGALPQFGKVHPSTAAPGMDPG